MLKKCSLGFFIILSPFSFLAMAQETQQAQQAVNEARRALNTGRTTNTSPEVNRAYNYANKQINAAQQMLNRVNSGGGGGSLQPRANIPRPNYVPENPTLEDDSDSGALSGPSSLPSELAIPQRRVQGPVAKKAPTPVTKVKSGMKEPAHATYQTGATAAKTTPKPHARAQAIPTPNVTAKDVGPGITALPNTKNVGSIFNVNEATKSALQVYSIKSSTSASNATSYGPSQVTQEELDSLLTPQPSWYAAPAPQPPPQEDQNTDPNTDQ